MEGPAQSALLANRTNTVDFWAMGSLMESAGPVPCGALLRYQV